MWRLTPLPSISILFNVEFITLTWTLTHTLPVYSQSNECVEAAPPVLSVHHLKCFTLLTGDWSEQLSIKPENDKNDGFLIFVWFEHDSACRVGLVINILPCVYITLSSPSLGRSGLSSIHLLPDSVFPS